MQYSVNLNVLVGDTMTAGMLMDRFSEVASGAARSVGNVSISCNPLLDDLNQEIPGERLFSDSNTIIKVDRGLELAGINETKRKIAIDEMANLGIVFRERD